MRTRKLDHEGVFAWIMPVVVAGLLAACGGGDAGAGGGAGETAGGTGAGTPAGGAGAEAPAGGAGAEAPPPAAGDTAPAGGAGGDAAAGGGGASALVALGDSVFHGQAGGGTCYVCHGQDGKGSGVGPNLTDAEWLNTDGTLAGITKTVQSGVPTPKKAPAPMPPMGGASLSPDQVKAVAAYVHTLGGGK